MTYSRVRSGRTHVIAHLCSGMFIRSYTRDQSVVFLSGLSCTTLAESLRTRRTMVVFPNENELSFHPINQCWHSHGYNRLFTSQRTANYIEMKYVLEGKRE